MEFHWEPIRSGGLRSISTLKHTSSPGCTFQQYFAWKKPFNLFFSIQPCWKAYARTGPLCGKLEEILPHPAKKRNREPRFGIVAFPLSSGRAGPNSMQKMLWRGQCKEYLEGCEQRIWAVQKSLGKKIRTFPNPGLSIKLRRSPQLSDISLRNQTPSVISLLWQTNFNNLLFLPVS